MTGEPFCHEHSGRILKRRVAARAVSTACAAFALLPAMLVLAPAVTPALRSTATAATTTATKSTCGLVIDVSRPWAGVPISASNVGSVQSFSVYLEPRLLERLKSDAAGRLTGRLDLPPDTRGPQTLRVTGANCSVAITFDAHAGPPNGPPPPPPPPQPIPPPAPIQVGLSNDLRYGLIALVVATAVLMLLLTSRLGRRTSSHN